MRILFFINKFIDLFFHSSECVKYGNAAPYWINPSELKGVQLSILEEQAMIFPLNWVYKESLIL